MRCAILLVLLTSVSALAAEDKPAKEPAALVQVRKAYEAKDKVDDDPITSDKKTRKYRTSWGNLMATSSDGSTLIVGPNMQTSKRIQEP